MGKSLVIKGADFSANGIPETIPEIDITELIDNSGEFSPCFGVNSFVSSTGSANNVRACFTRLSIGDIFPNVSSYGKIRIDIKTGFDFVLGMCRSEDDLNVSSSWIKLDGTNTSAGSFSWVTDKQYAEVPVSDTMYITGNFRYDDNTTTFTNTTKFSDVASIKLIP